MLRRALACVAALAAFSAAEVRARADDRLRTEAVGQYEAGQFAAAAGAFAAVFVQERNPADLFAWAQSERMWGKCDRAVELYSVFLSFDPPAANREAASRGFDLCSGEVALELTRPGYLATEQGRATLERLLQRGYALSGNPWFLYAMAMTSPEAVRCGRAQSLLERVAREAGSALLRELVTAEERRCASLAAPDQPAVIAPRPPARARPWYRDAWGGVLTGSGIAAAVAGGVLIYVGHSRIEDADRQTYGSFAADIGSGTTLRTVGTISTAAGAVLIGLGIWRYRVAGSRVSMLPRAQGDQVGLALIGEF